MSERTVTFRFRINADPFLRGMHDAAQTMTRLPHRLRGQAAPPREPYRKHYSGMTARQYRAARRRYRRELTAWERGAAS